ARAARMTVLGEVPVPDHRPDPLSALSAREVLEILDEEIQRLPERYRLAVVLCHLDGRTYAEAARLLGCTVGTLRGRLERGRRRLHDRLVRRGLTLAAALALAGVARAGGVPASLAGATVAAALEFAAAPQGNLVPAEAARLAGELLGAASLARTTLALALSLGLLALGAGALAGSWHHLLSPVAGDEPAARRDEAPPPAQERPVNAGPRLDLHGDPLPPGTIARLGTIRFRHAFLGPYFLPDGKGLVTANRQAVQLWEATTGRLVWETPTGSLHVTGIALTPDGRAVEVSGRAGARVLDAATGKDLPAVPVRAPEPRPTANPPAVSPDGKVRAALEKDLLQFHELATSKLLRTADLSAKKIFHPSLTFSPDGQVLAVTDLGNRKGCTGGLFLWDVARHRLLHEFITPGEQVYRAAFTRDGQLVAVTTT